MMNIIKAKDVIEQAAARMILHGQNGEMDLMPLVPKTRIPSDMSVSRSLRKNAEFPAGRVLSITTNEPVKIRVCYKKRRNLTNMDGKATSGIDVYRKKDGTYEHLETIYPDRKNAMYAEAYIEESGELHLMLPSYASLDHLFISSGNPVPCPHGSKGKRVVCYGSSITQGCAASRPGKSYVNMLYLDGYDTLNYGFSESAKGEPEIIKHIAKEYADIYILEYDHNASVKELRESHLNTYRIIREFNPDSMIIFLSRISGGISISEAEERERIAIIEATIRTANEEGDRNTYFICGTTEKAKRYLQDDRHPNDSGMELIKRRITNCVRENT